MAGLGVARAAATSLLLASPSGRRRGHNLQQRPGVRACKGREMQGSGPGLVSEAGGRGDHAACNLGRPSQLPREARRGQQPLQRQDRDPAKRSPQAPCPLPMPFPSSPRPSSTRARQGSFHPQHLPDRSRRTKPGGGTEQRMQGQSHPHLTWAQAMPAEAVCCPDPGCPCKACEERWLLTPERTSTDTAPLPCAGPAGCLDLNYSLLGCPPWSGRESFLVVKLASW